MGFGDFWHSVGALFSDKGADKNAVPGTFNQAQAISASAGPTFGRFGVNFTGTDPGLESNPFVHAAFEPINLIGGAIHAASVPVQAVDHGLTAAGLHSSGLTWDQAWAATQSGGVTVGGQHLANVNLGQYAVRSLTSNPFKAPDLTTGKHVQDFNNLTQNTWTGRISSGLLDTVATWYLDPTLGVGKAAKLAKASSSLKDATAFDEATKAAHDINTGAVAQQSAISRINPFGKTGLFSSAMEKSGQQLFRTAVKTDNKGIEQSPEIQAMLARNPNSAPFMGLWDQASEIADLDLQRQVKIDIMGASGNSAVSMQRLIEQAPDIARATQRTQEVPAGRNAIDDISEAINHPGPQTPQTLQAGGQAYIDAANAMKTPENLAELDALQPHLDSVLSQLEGLALQGRDQPLETAGTTALQRVKGAYRDAVARQVYYQAGPSSATVQAMHWQASQSFRGQISTDTPYRGTQQLMDYVGRTKLFSGAEKQAINKAYLTAGTKEARVRQLDQLHSTVITKVANKMGMSEAEVTEMVHEINNKIQAGRQYGTAELSAAKQNGKDTMFLLDPTTQKGSYLKTALYESHIANNVHLMDPTEIEDIVKAVRRSPKSRGDLLDDGLHTAAAKFSGAADAYNNVWRLGVLGRPGLLPRTQFDTQGRNLAVMGGTAVLAAAMKGVGHVAQGAVHGRNQQVAIDGMAADIHEAEVLEAKAAVLEARAAGMEAGNRVPLPTTNIGPRPKGVQARADVLHGKDDASLGAAPADLNLNPTRESVLADAADLRSQGQVLRDTKYWAHQYRQGTQDYVLQLGKGRTMTTRAYHDTVDESNIDTHALYPGGAQRGAALSASLPQGDINLLARSIDRHQARLVADSHNYKTYAPTHVYHSVAWALKTNVIRNTYTGRAFLRAGDTPIQVLADQLRNDPHVLSEYKTAHEAGETLDEWLQRSEDDVLYMAPSKEIRAEILSGRDLNADDADRLFSKATKNKDGSVNLADGTGRPERPYVEGAALSPLSQEKKKGGIYDGPGAIRRMVGFLSDKPDQVWGRHPLYINRYNHHVAGLATRELDRTGEAKLTAEAQAHIETVAKHRAIQDVQQTMYDTAKYTGAHATLRWASPFLGAWQDAMESWTRLFYDDPTRATRFQQAWNIPNRMGLVVDENGNVVQPGQQANQSFLVLPESLNNNFKDSKKFLVRKDALNSIFQGAQWYTPGFGPLIQFPAQELVARIHPEWGDSKNPIWQSVLPFGAPKTASAKGFLGLVPAVGSDALNESLPGWVRTIYNPHANAQAFLNSVNQQMIQARLDGKPVPSRTELYANASAATRSGQIIRALSLGLLGVTGQSSNLADFYRRQYNAIFSQDPINATKTFNQKHPEAAGLSWNLTKSQTGVQATVQAWQSEQKEAAHIKQFPAAGWFFVGNANVGGQFSQSVYNAQSSRATDMNGTTERALQKQGDLVDASLANDGWMKYEAFMQQINNGLVQMGLHSLTQKDAAPLAKVRDAFVASLSASDPAWAKDFKPGPNKVEQFIDGPAAAALADPKLKGRSDIVALSQYLQVRKQVLDALAGIGIKSLTAERAKPLRDLLNQVGTGLAQGNFGFQQTWNRVFMNETLPTTAEQLKAQEAG